MVAERVPNTQISSGFCRATKEPSSAGANRTLKDQLRLPLMLATSTGATRQLTA
jgi:hypothetical protein